MFTLFEMACYHEASIAEINQKENEIGESRFLLSVEQTKQMLEFIINDIRLIYGSCSVVAEAYSFA